METDMGNKNSSTLERIDTTNVEFPEDCVIALYGNLTLGRKHDEIRKETEKWGASFEDHDSRVEKCTHLITTEKYVKKSIMPAKIKDAARKGCEIVTLTWLLFSIECGYPIDTKDYRLETAKIAGLRPKANDKASSKPEADGPKSNTKKANKVKPKAKETNDPEPKLKEVDEPNPRLERTDKAKPKPKEADEIKLGPIKADKPKPKLKGSGGAGEAKRALEGLEDAGDGTKKVAKTSSDANYLHFLQSTVNEFFPDLPKGLSVWVQDDDEWDAILIKPLVGKTGERTRHFVTCRIQLLCDLTESQYHTFSHEKTGEVITKASRLGLGSLEDAKAAFQEIFHDATGLRWKSRLEDPKQDKFIYVEHHLKDDEAIDSALDIAKTLPPAVKAVLNTIAYGTDQSYLIKAFLTKQPTGPISNGSMLVTVHHLRAGIALLKRLLGRPDLAAEMTTNGGPASMMLQCYHYLIGDGLSKAPPSLAWIQREQDHLSYLYVLATASQPDRPPGWVEKQLSQHLPRVFGLTHMALVDSTTEEYRILENYFNFSDMSHAYGRGYNYYKNKLKNIFRIERLGEADRFLKWMNAEKDHGRCLLWHGSGNYNFKGIFEKGLVGGLGEPKIFLSDLAGYSTSYCIKGTGMKVGMPNLMLLCEVGSPRFSNKYTKSDWWCDAGCVHPDLHGVKMLKIPPGVKFCSGGWPIQKEYSFRKAEQIRMRYLFEFDMESTT
ncbi:poly polymerase 2 [Penicillium frequentans]|uniref:Poly [ADP-ribose] polymerase n=1 Tax=Penicillium frequentans TaxID=3151616 RepID=A0AAD6D570_9EURO|nr:poly polymerase 2 [Penicillium glabrum]